MYFHTDNWNSWSWRIYRICLATIFPMLRWQLYDRMNQAESDHLRTTKAGSGSGKIPFTHHYLDSTFLGTKLCMYSCPLFNKTSHVLYIYKFVCVWVHVSSIDFPVFSGPCYPSLNLQTLELCTLFFAESYRTVCRKSSNTSSPRGLVLKSPGNQLEKKLIVSSEKNWLSPWYLSASEQLIMVLNTCGW